MGPIAADYLHVPSSKPTVFTVVNDAASACNGSCSFVFNNARSPTLTNAAETSRSDKLTTYKLRGSAFFPPAEVDVPLTQIQVLFRSTVDVNKEYTLQLRRRNLMPSRREAGVSSTRSSARSLLSINGTAETISRTESCTITQATNESITCELGPASAGVYKVVVVVPGRGSSPQNVSLVYGLVVDTVTPNTVRGTNLSLLLILHVWMHTDA
jgi:hypothetical protein